MKLQSFFRKFIPVLIVLMISNVLTAQTIGRSVRDFSQDWKFFRGDMPDGQDPGLNDSDWRALDLPHDWSIEGPFSSNNYSCTGYLPGGTGWYRKIFTLNADENGRKVFIYFDGVYNNSEVWINGNFLGKRPNGYISFMYDLTPYIRFDKENVIAVKVDHSLFGDSRWYTGSGIYRKVQLITSSTVYIKHWGVNCRTPEVTPDRASLSADISLINESSQAVSVSVISSLIHRGKIVSVSESRIDINPRVDTIINQAFVVDKPELWSIANPAIYSLVTEVKGKDLLDNTTTKFGFRSIRFDPDKGFFLNGENMKLKGICMHHDAGTLGSAVPAEEWSRRLDILKDMGCNAIRTSHNPFSVDFLDLCDTKGFLVIDEAFDEWELPKKKWLAGWNVGQPGKEGYSTYFKEWAERDLRDMVLRDRNHPSVIMWSIGNEVDYPNDPYSHPVLNTEDNPQTWAKYSTSLPYAGRLGEIARQLASIIRGLDRSRPVTAGLASALMSNETGYADDLDVAGYNYQEFRYSADHAKYPQRPLYGSENGMTLDMWNYVASNDYVMGQFLWTGYEYMGEAGRYPSRSNTAGTIDLAGNRKPEFYFRQSLWSDKPMVFIGTSDPSAKSGPDNLWSHKRVEPLWNREEGRVIHVSAFTNCDEVELYINGRSLGICRIKDHVNRVLSWDVPFEKGTLRAVARKNGVEAAWDELKTFGTPFLISAICDEESIIPGKTDITRLFVEIHDREGNLVYTAGNEITCDTEGPVRLIGMEDSNPSNTEDYKDNKQNAFHGKLLIYLQANGSAGQAKIRLSSPGLEDIVVKIPVTGQGSQAQGSHPE